MGSMLAACLGSCIATCGCQAASCCCSSLTKSDSRLPYIALTFTTTVVAGILRYYGKPFLIKIPGLDGIGCQDSRCYGIGAVYMFMFALSVFYLTFALINLSASCAKRDGGSWLIKILYFFGLLVASFFLPQDLFDGYAVFAQGLSGIFVVVQIVLLINFTYSWNESWLSPERGWKKGVLAASLLLYIISLVAVSLLFYYYGLDDTNRGFISVTLVVSLLFSALSATEWCTRGAILPSSACTVYCYWILYSALSASPVVEAKYAAKDNTAVTILGFIISGASVSYAGWSMANSASIKNSGYTEDLVYSDVEDVEDGGEKKKYGANDSSINDSMGVSTTPSDEASSSSSSKKKSSPTASSRFHVVMATAACYAAMLLTDWGQSPDGQHGAGKATMWIQIVGQWICMLLYTWSLIAPQVLTNREF